MKKLLIFLLIMTIGPPTLLSQITNLPESSRDSLTISREQANEVANGLVNEGRLKEAYNQLSQEHETLERTYVKSRARNIRFKDTLIPFLEGKIDLKEEEITTKDGFTKSLEISLKAQKRKKWKHGLIGAAAGVLLTLLLTK